MKTKIVVISQIALLLASGCKKLVNVPEPINSLTTQETFNNEGNATSAVVAIYNDMTSGGGGTFAYANGLTSYACGLTSDELAFFDQSNQFVVQFQKDALQSSNYMVNSYFWVPAYFDLYTANADMEGLAASTTITNATRQHLTGEAQFLRAFIDFYLLNLFGHIPLVNSTAWANTGTLGQATTDQVYSQITSDLQAAQGLLPADYSAYNGQRWRAIKWAATALLARVYLYRQDYTGADSAATAVINNSALYTIDPRLTDVFLANSQEAIWQLVPNASSNFATWEANQNLPNPLNSGNPIYYVTSTLLNAFETSDKRRAAWLDSTNYSGTVYYYPYKYQVPTASPSNAPEYFMMLRLAEQYLIRAEAKINEAQPDFAGAINDLNVIRIRAGLAGYTGAQDKADIMNAIVHERQVELFAEWGHRWFDLQRWGSATTVLSANKGITVPVDKLIFPIPYIELQPDPNLVQNPGY